MMIDWTISIGALLQIGSFLIVGVGAFFAIRSDIKVIDFKLLAIESRQNLLGSAFESIGHVMRDMAVQNTRIAQAEKMIDELRHGEGLVVKDNGRANHTP